MSQSFFWNCLLCLLCLFVYVCLLGVRVMFVYVYLKMLITLRAKIWLMHPKIGPSDFAQTVASILDSLPVIFQSQVSPPSKIGFCNRKAKLLLAWNIPSKSSVYGINSNLLASISTLSKLFGGLYQPVFWHKNTRKQQNMPQ